ncbi:MAG TPA: hypothetical protein VK524_15090 [Polyangiaceae bacterium]|nr:hypothetical protein [Polyangiaceae bacterium]
MHGATLRNLQLRIEEFYGLEQAPDIVEFVRVADEDERETVLIRQDGEYVEIAVVLPKTVKNAHPRQYATDTWLQLIEAVSHFVYISERARIGLPATQLELELQAEVDKFVVAALSSKRLGHERARKLHGQLYEKVRFIHPEGSEAGVRYRLANELAARFIARLLFGRDVRAHRGVLRQFYRSGQTDKIRLARAA